MKKLSKTLLAVAAVSAVSAAMAASAMAMDASYVKPADDPEGIGYVALNGVEANGDSQTLLIYKSEDGEGTFNTVDYTTDDIEAINQEDGDAETPGSVAGNIPVGDLAEGTYQVRVAGSEGTMQFASFEVTSGGGEDPDPGQTMIVVIGDVDDDDSADARDAAKIATFDVGTVRTGYNDRVGKRYNVSSGSAAETLTIGDVDNDGSADARDAAKIATFDVGTVRSGYNDSVGNSVTVGVDEITE